MNEYEREAYEDKIDATRMRCPHCDCLTYFELDVCPECGLDLLKEVPEEAEDERKAAFEELAKLSQDMRLGYE